MIRMRARYIGRERKRWRHGATYMLILTPLNARRTVWRVGTVASFSDAHDLDHPEPFTTRRLLRWVWPITDTRLEVVLSS